MAGVIIAAALAWGAGALWYMGFSARWTRLSGIKLGPDGKPENASAAPFIISAIAMLIVAGMMRHIFGMAGIEGFGKGLVSGLGVGAFIIAPWIVLNYAYSQRPTGLMAIDGGYAILASSIMGAVLGLM